MYRSSLFARLMRRVGLVMLLVSGMLITAAWIYARAAADVAFDRLLLGAAFQMSENLAVADGKLRFVLPPSAFELLGLADRDRIFYRIIGPGGDTLTGYVDLAGQTDLASSRSVPTFNNTNYMGAPVRAVTIAHAVSLPDGPDWAYVVVAQTTQARRALASELTTHATLLVSLMSLIALMGTALAVRYSLKPVNDLATALRERDPKDLRPLKIEVPREIHPFVTSINYFITRLDERIKLLQRYIADSAHQIRTPLTALSAQVSLINEGKLEADDRRHLARVQNRTAELAALTNQLLNHAMVIHRFDSIQLTPVSLNDVARMAFRTAVPITVDPDIVVSFEAADDDLQAMGDVLSLREAIVNVIDNALRHGAVHRLDVRVRRQGNTGRIEVMDDGPGIREEEWQKIISRFYSKSPDTRGSSGLGFAIAAEVATVLGGRLDFMPPSPEKPFCVYLELPLIEGCRQ